MSHINTVALSGRTTRDPEYVQMPSGNNLAKFGLAVERSWVDKTTQERVVKTSFFDINVWGPFADVIHAKVRKGDPISLTGTLEQERWVTDLQENRARVIVNANQIDGEALFRKADGSDTPAREATQPEQHAGQQQMPQQQFPPQQANTPPPAGVSSPPAAVGEHDDGIPF